MSKRIFGALFLLAGLLANTTAFAIEFRGAEYEVYEGDVNGDGISDIYLRAPDLFVLLHGDIATPLLIRPDHPSYLIESVDLEVSYYKDPIVNENVDVKTLTLSNGVAYKVDKNGDGVTDLAFGSNSSLLYSFVIDGRADKPARIISADIPVPTLNSNGTDPVNDPLEGDIYYGHLPGEYKVNAQGAFNYEIPIEVSPGINGLEPKLSFHYNSETDNGIMGLGWGLKGLTAVSRCKASLAKDGYQSTLNFNDNYKFCLDGMRLVEVGVREYRTESEQFARITAFGGSERAPQFWEVELKDGQVLFFGQYYASVKFDDGNDRRRWNISYRRDAAGNFMKYSYENGYISKVEYGVQEKGKSVEFKYESRPDALEHYVAGDRVYVDKRLNRVEVRVNGTLIRNYQIAYHPPTSDSFYAVGNVSRVQKITRCYRTLTDCNAFQYVEWEEDISDSAFKQKIVNNYYGAGDFNADGKLDTIKITKNENLYTVSVQPFSGGPSEAWLTTSAALGIRPTIMDITGDGLDDVVFHGAYDVYGYKRPVQVLKSTGSSFVFQQWADPNSEIGDGGNFKKQILDVNADGLPDLVVTEGRFGIRVRLNTGSGFSPWETWYDPYPADWDKAVCGASKSFKYVDFNGDSLPDVLLCQSNDVYCTPTVLINTGKSFVKDTKWQGKNGNFYYAFAADVNGDGKADQIMIEGDNVWVNLSTGTSFTSAKSWLTSTANSVGHPRHPTTSFADLTGDNCADMYYKDTGNHEAYIYVAISTCNADGGFLPLQEWDSEDHALFAVKSTQEDLMLTGGVGGEATTLFHKMAARDINGDGIADLIAQDYFRISDGGKPRVAKISSFDHIAADIADREEMVSSHRIVYDPIIDSPVYSADGTIVNVGGVNSAGKGKHVARTVIVTGRSGQREIRTYQYKNYVSNLQGWGALGFSSMTEKLTYSSGDYVKTVDEYRQDIGANYRVAGVLKSKKVYTKPLQETAESLIASDVFHWKVRLYNDDRDAQSTTPAFFSPHFFLYQYQNSRAKWDIDGTKIFEAKTRNYKASTSDCALLEDGGIRTTQAGSSSDSEYSAYGVLKYQETAMCDTSNSSSSVTVTATEKSAIRDIISSDIWVVGLPQREDRLAWVGTDITKRSFDKRSTLFTYYDTGLLHTQTIAPDTSLERITTYSYNDYGSIYQRSESWDPSIASNERSGINFSSRLIINNESWSETGVRTQEATNPLNQKSTEIYETIFGKMESVENVNGLKRELSYDNAGRLTELEDEAGVVTTNSYRRCEGCFSYNTNATWYQQVKTSGKSASRVYYDDQGREVGTREKGLTGKFIYTYKKYNDRGLLKVSTEPFFQTEEVYETIYTYDVLGRLTRTEYSDGTAQINGYSGLSTNITNREGQSQQQVINGRGWDVLTINSVGTKLEFSYWPFGELKSTRVNEDDRTLTRIEYDSLGRKTKLDDKNAGITKYTNNPIDQVSVIEHANGRVAKYQFDRLGRSVRRTDNFGAEGQVTHDWIFDSKNNGIGKLGTVSGYDTKGNPYIEDYSYDSDGNLIAKEVIIDGIEYTTTYHYDIYGRNIGQTYPGGLTTRNTYNSYGYVQLITQIPSNKMLWKAGDQNSFGDISRFMVGNGVDTIKTYDHSSGRVKTITARQFFAAPIQDQEFEFSPLGNLRKRTDHKNGISEAFCYDDINRLRASSGESCNEAHVDFAYDDLGNIVQKHGVSGTFGYGDNAGPNALTSAKGLSYSYDRSGNMTEAKDGSGNAVKEVSYTAFNKPSFIRNGSDWTEIIYGATKNRIKKGGSDGTNVTYVGLNHYEINRYESDENVVQKISYIGDFALYIIEEGRSVNRSYYVYLHRDHLGSIVIKSPQQAVNPDSIISLANDAWGSRLQDVWLGSNVNTDYMSLDSSRGFTNHEHLDPLGLIHMNGRVYDPELGRFLSPDPFIQFPQNTQSYNRYSYVLNNPLSYTDSTGYQIDEEVIVTGYFPVIDWTANLQMLDSMNTTVVTGIENYNAPSGISGDMGVGAVDPTGNDTMLEDTSDIRYWGGLRGTGNLGMKGLAKVEFDLNLGATSKSIITGKRYVSQGGFIFLNLGPANIGIGANREVNVPKYGTGSIPFYLRNTPWDSQFQANLNGWKLNEFGVVEFGGGVLIGGNITLDFRAPVNQFVKIMTEGSMENSDEVSFGLMNSIYAF